MNSKAHKSKARVSKHQPQRTDYHQQQQSVSSDDESQELLEYDWSGVIAIYKDDAGEIEVVSAEIDVDHMKTDMKAARGRPLAKWDFIFSPEKFDREISIDQFNNDPLPLDDM